MHTHTQTHSLMIMKTMMKQNGKQQHVSVTYIAVFKCSMAKRKCYIATHARTRSHQVTVRVDPRGEQKKMQSEKKTRTAHTVQAHALSNVYNYDLCLARSCCYYMPLCFHFLCIVLLLDYFHFIYLFFLLHLTGVLYSLRVFFPLSLFLSIYLALLASDRSPICCA